MKYGSVCSGVEAASLAWMPLGWECVFVSEVEPFPCAVLQQRFGATAPIHPLDPEEASDEKDRKMRIAWMKQNAKLNKEGKIPNEGDFTKIGKKYAGKIDLLVGGTPCFTAGAMVLTPDGYKPIETLRVGDKVVSHLGNICEITAVGNKTANIGTVKVLGRPEIECTEDHPFYSVRMKRDTRRNSESYCQKIPDGEFEFMAVKNAVGRYAGRVFVKPCDCDIPSGIYSASEEDIIELAGWYVGDGYIRRWTGKNKKSVIIALVSPQKIELFKKRFSRKINFSTGKDGKIGITNTRLADWLLKNFGEHADGKHVPYWIYSHPMKKLFISGYEVTDGGIIGGKMKITTVSPALAYGIADLYGDASVFFTERPKTHIICGREVSQKNTFTVCKTYARNSHTKLINGRYASKIRRWNNENGKTGIVFNITVQGDNSYIVNGIAVHNCQDLSVAGKRAGFDGKRSCLAIDFVRLAYESQCKWFVWENVPGVFSSNGGRDFATLLSLFTGCEVGLPEQGFGNAGFVCNARRDRFGVAWRVLDAQFTRVPGFPFAIPQRRRRVFVVGYFGDWTKAAEVCLEPDRLSWDTPARIKTREIFAGNAGTDAGMAGGEFLIDNGKGKKTNVSNTLDCKCKDGAIRNGIGCVVVETGEFRSSQHGNFVKTETAGTIKQNSASCGNSSATLKVEYAAGFVGRQGADAGSVAYEENVSPVIRSAITADVLCVVHESGPGYWQSENVSGCLRAEGENRPSRPSNVICCHGSQDPICNDSHANAVNRNNGLENCIMETYSIGNGQAGELNAMQKEVSQTLHCMHDQQAIVSQYGEVAGTLEARHDSSPCPDRGQNIVCMNPHDPQNIRVYGENGVWPNLNANENGGQNRASVLCRATQQANAEILKDCCPTITESAGTSGNNQPILVENDHAKCFQQNTRDEVRMINGDGCIAGALSAEAGAKQQNYICYENHAQDSRIKELHGVFPQINAKAGMGGGNLPLVQECYPINGMVIGKEAKDGDRQTTGIGNDNDPSPTIGAGQHHAVAIAENIIGRKVENGGNGVGAQEELAYTQNATGTMGVCSHSFVRRLTPIEAERLMGFPDNHTRIAYNGKPEDECPDSPRYKACGNSMCVNVMEWIGRQIERVSSHKLQVTREEDEKHD